MRHLLGGGEDLFMIFWMKWIRQGGIAETNEGIAGKKSSVGIVCRFQEILPSCSGSALLSERRKPEQTPLCVVPDVAVERHLNKARNRKEDEKGFRRQFVPLPI